MFHCCQPILYNSPIMEISTEAANLWPALLHIIAHPLLAAQMVLVCRAFDYLRRNRDGRGVPEAFVLTIALYFVVASGVVLACCLSAAGPTAAQMGVQFFALVGIDLYATIFLAFALKEANAANAPATPRQVVR